jgi:hypothetical protein
MTVEMLDGILGVVDILKLDKAHGSVDLLPEAHPLVAVTSLEQSSQRLFEIVWR